MIRNNTLSISKYKILSHTWMNIRDGFQRIDLRISMVCWGSIANNKIYSNLQVVVL
jgi:hypothetical protein